MPFGLQDLIAIGVVLAAAAYLISLAVRAVVRKPSTQCGGGCPRCGSASQGLTEPRAEVVSIGPMPGKS